jgi:hypothetical protein
MFCIADSDDLYPRYFDFPELEKHPGINEGFAPVPGVLAKSSKNRKNPPPWGTLRYWGVWPKYLRYNWGKWSQNRLLSKFRMTN